MKTKLKDMPPKLKLVILAALGIFGVLLVIIGSSGGKKAVAQKIPQKMRKITQLWHI